MPRQQFQFEASIFVMTRRRSEFGAATRGIQSWCQFVIQRYGDTDGGSRGPGGAVSAVGPARGPRPLPAPPRRPRPRQREDPHQDVPRRVGGRGEIKTDTRNQEFIRCAPPVCT